MLVLALVLLVLVLVVGSGVAAAPERTFQVTDPGIETAK